MSSTLASTLSLRDVLDVEALVRKVLDDRLRFWGARLQPHDYEDAVSFLIGQCWELSQRYDPARDKRPNFAAYASRILTLRVADWYRQRFGDTRHGPRPVVLSLDAPAGGSGSEDDLGSGRGLVSALASSDGDPAHDRAPDLVGVLHGRGGSAAEPLEALGESKAGRAQGRARGASGSSGSVSKKPRIPGTRRATVPPPVCPSCMETFKVAFGRANEALPLEQRMTDADILERSRRRAAAVKFAGEWVCPRCTTLPTAEGQVAFFDQVYPNRAARRAARRS